MKHNKSADTLLFLLSLTKFKYIERIFFVNAGVDLGTTLTEYLQNPKKKLPERFLIIESIFVFLSTDKKSYKGFIKGF